jgi:hypothetical protein
MSEMQNPMLAKIQNLLNTYQSLLKTEPEGAQSYLEKAEQLMQKYAIDAAMLAQATQLAGGKVENPEKRPFTFMPSKDELGNQWYNLIIAVAKHYDCEFIGWTAGNGYLVGFPSNLNLVEMVYTSLRLQAISKLDPKPDRRKSFDENVYDMHEAGIKWRNIAFLMNQAYYEEKDLGRLDRLGIPDDTDSTWSFRVNQDSAGWQVVPWEVNDKGVGKKDGGRLIRAAKRWAKKIDEPYRAVATPVTFRRSYAQGFLQEVRERFARLRKYREDQVRSTSGAELVLFDRNKLVTSTMEELKESLGFKGGKSYRQNVVDEAYDRGRQDGRTADLGQDRMSGRKKEIS